MSSAHPAPTPPDVLLALWREQPPFEVMALPVHYPSVDGPRGETWGDFQKGYRVHGRTGEQLVSEEPGEWHPDWWVVAINSFSDPFFIDLREADTGYPVYTIIGGGSPLKVHRIADSVEQLREWRTELWAREFKPAEAETFVRDHLPDNDFWREVAGGYARRPAQPQMRFLLLSDLLEQAPLLPWDFAIYIATQAAIDAHAPLLVHDADDVDPDTELPPGVATSEWRYLLGLADARSVVQNARAQRPDATPDDLLTAFRHYIERDAFIVWD